MDGLSKYPHTRPFYEIKCIYLKNGIIAPKHKQILWKTNQAISFTVQVLIRSVVPAHAMIYNWSNLGIN